MEPGGLSIKITMGIVFRKAIKHYISAVKEKK